MMPTPATRRAKKAPASCQQAYAKKKVILLALWGVLGAAHADNQDRQHNDEARRIGQRYEEEVREQARIWANTPPLVAPPMPIDDVPPPSHTTFGRGEVGLDCNADNLHGPRGELYKRRCAEERKKKHPLQGTNTLPDGSGATDDSRGHTTNAGELPPKLSGYPNHSCWAAPKWCLQSTGGWGVSNLDLESRRFYTHHKNTCSQRISVKVCVGREGRKPYCGSSGIDPGKTWIWDVSRSTGYYRAMFSGVARGKDDYICPKPAGWKELGEADFDEVEKTSTTSRKEKPVSASDDTARAWCMKKKNGEFWCNGPLQNGGWGRTLKAALKMVGCQDGSGDTPTIGTGGQPFNCGRELKSYERRMPLHDPFYDREKPL